MIGVGVVPMQEVRHLAQRFSADELERCLEMQFASGDNVCIRSGSADEIISALAEAEFVREQVENGIPLRDAVRELARRIRALQRGSIDAG